MKNLNIVIDDSLFLEIEKRTTPDFDHNDVIEKLLRKALLISQPNNPPLQKLDITPKVLSGESIIKYVQSPRYGVMKGIEKYLAVLGWVHKNKRAEFEKVLNYRKGNRVYFGKSQQQVEVSGQSIRAKLIPGSTFWALETLDNRAKRKLLMDVLRLCNFHPNEVRLVADSIPDSDRNKNMTNIDLGY